MIEQLDADAGDRLRDSVRPVDGIRQRQLDQVADGNAKLKEER